MIRSLNRGLYKDIYIIKISLEKKIHHENISLPKKFEVFSSALIPNSVTLSVL